LTQTVAKNIQEYGTGALNIDACRVSGEAVPINKLDGWSGFGELKQPDYTQEINDKGRWPANLIHDGSDEVTQLFPDTGKSTGGRIGKKENSYVDNAPTGQYEKGDPGYGDSGTAARFFYCAKVSRREREAGCDTLPAKTAGEATGGRQEGSAGLQSPRAGASRTSTGVHNDHPTVKPIALMRYLIRLVTPRHGTVLDLFMGSGTTGCAAVLEGANFVGIDLEQHHVDIAEARIAYWQTHPYEDANEKKPLDSAPTCALPLD
jgi:site-specific DNA-methyltransferase (adenine-specific)